MDTVDRILHGIGTAVLFIFAIIIMTAGGFMVPSNRDLGFMLILLGSVFLVISIERSKSKEKGNPEKADRFQFR